MRVLPDAHTSMTKLLLKAMRQGFDAGKLCLQSNARSSFEAEVLFYVADKRGER
jgi:hypothetical protein